VDPAELRQRAIELEVDSAVLRRALLGEAGAGSAGRNLLADAIECAEDETGG
jgi:hypothetical protein